MRIAQGTFYNSSGPAGYIATKYWCLSLAHGAGLLNNANCVLHYAAGWAVDVAWLSAMQSGLFRTFLLVLPRMQIVTNISTTCHRMSSWSR